MLYIKEEKRVVINLKFINTFLALFVVISGVFYLTNINNLAVKGFGLQELRNEASRATNENLELETKITFLESYGNMTEKVDKLGMVTVDSIDYIITANSAMAKK